MTDLQGAIGLVQLGKLDRFIERARDAGRTFYRCELVRAAWLRLPAVPQTGSHAWQAFVTYVDPATAPMPRNEIMEHLQSARHRHPARHARGAHARLLPRAIRLAAEDFPAARDCDANTMAIPLHNRMSADDYKYVADALLSL